MSANDSNRTGAGPWSPGAARSDRARQASLLGCGRAASLVATYRLQFRGGVGFEEAAGLAPYLAKLGVSHLYASPVFEAAPGSTHGYDVADPNALEPSLGGRGGFGAMAAALRAQGLGLVLDTVPNHVGNAPNNPWWASLLRWGEDSPFARHFDVDWAAERGPFGQGRALLPRLGASLGEVVADGQLAVAASRDPADLHLAYYDHRFPLDPRTWPLALEAAGSGDALSAEQAEALRAATPGGFEALRAGLAQAFAELPERLELPAEALLRLHDRQAYRLAWWREGNSSLNWRRFFDVTDLAGVRVEDPAVFADAHRLLLELWREGSIDGVRLDHVDGLADPGGYLKDLDAALREADPKRRPWLLVEKILGPEERLPESWPVAGTTGYEALAAIQDALVDPNGRVALDEAWAEVGGEDDFRALVAEAKRAVVTTVLDAEAARLARRLHGIARAERRDLPKAAIRGALDALLVAFPVYRTYGYSARGEGSFSAEDRERLEGALERAGEGLREPARSALAFLREALLERGPSDEACRPALAAFEQLTGPATAKALEDTAFYRYHRLIALNEVGGEPDRFGRPDAELHEFWAERAKREPFSLTATSTHDTKRGEDARARILALSELAEPFAAKAPAWRESLAGNVQHLPAGPAPEPATQHLIFQSLLGAWPPGLEPDEREGLAALAERLVTFLEKAGREAKRRTSWLEPDGAYEEAVAGYARAALDPERSSAFLGRFSAFAGRLALPGALNGLAQTALKLTLPGVPDVYQGTEGWDQSFVDPDNRRPVGWDDLAAGLGSVPAPGDAGGWEALLASWRDGRIKQALAARLLAIRAADPDLWARGAYRPVRAEGEHAGSVFAFERSLGDRAALVAVTRRAATLLEGQDRPRVPAGRWGGTRLVLPEGWGGEAFEVVSGRPSPLAGGAAPLAESLAAAPVAVVLRGRRHSA